MTYRLFTDLIPGLDAHIIDPWDPEFIDYDGMTPEEWDASDQILVDEIGAQMINNYVIRNGYPRSYLCQPAG